MATKVAGYIPNGIPLQLPQTRAGMGHGAVVAGHLRAVTTQEYASVVWHSRAYKRDQFRIDWKAKAFWMLFRSDEVANSAVHRTGFIRSPDDSARIKNCILVRPRIISCPVNITPSPR